MKRSRHFLRKAIKYIIENGYILHSRKKYESLRIFHFFFIKEISGIKYGLTLEYFDRDNKFVANRRFIDKISDLDEVL